MGLMNQRRFYRLCYSSMMHGYKGIVLPSRKELGSPVLCVVGLWALRYLRGRSILRSAGSQELMNFRA